MKTAERHAAETGMAKGMEQGLQQGLQQGMQQGLSDGIAQTNLENAKKMLKLNIDFETIYKVTGITKEELC